MRRYLVIAEFVDAVTGDRRFPGEEIEADEARAQRLVAAAVIDPTPLPVAGEDAGADPDPDQGSGPDPDSDPRYTALSGGWYQLTGGRKVRGRAALEAALAALEKGSSSEGGEG